MWLIHSSVPLSEGILHCITYYIAGFAGISPNLYVYAGNNPLAVKDPTGEFVAILVASAASAGYAAATYLVTTPPSQYTIGGRYACLTIACGCTLKEAASFTKLLLHNVHMDPLQSYFKKAELIPHLCNLHTI